MGGGTVTFSGKVDLSSADRLFDWSGVHVVIAVGDEAENIAAGACAEGAHVFVTTVEEAAESLSWTSHDVVLLKASRGLALERVGRAVFEDREAQA